jgi:hypothetical protein
LPDEGSRDQVPASDEEQETAVFVHK